MANKEIKTRIQNKNDTSENWAKAVNFVPLKGEIIIYNDLRLTKIGDGVTKVNDLPFEAAPEHNHATISIGPFSYDGTQNVTIPIYDGETNT